MGNIIYIIKNANNYRINCQNVVTSFVHYNRDRFSCRLFYDDTSIRKPQLGNTVILKMNITSNESKLEHDDLHDEPLATLTFVLSIKH